jgi:hypothetical protein
VNFLESSPSNVGVARPEASRVRDPGSVDDRPERESISD